MTYMLLLNCALKLVEEIILYYDARSRKHQTNKSMLIVLSPTCFSLYYTLTSNQQDATLAVLFISNCKITLHISDVHRVHHQEYINFSSSHWCMSWVRMKYIQ